MNRNEELRSLVHSNAPTLRQASAEAVGSHAKALSVAADAVLADPSEAAARRLVEVLDAASGPLAQSAGDLRTIQDAAPVFDWPVPEHESAAQAVGAAG